MKATTAHREESPSSWQDIEGNAGQATNDSIDQTHATRSSPSPHDEGVGRGLGRGVAHFLLSYGLRCGLQRSAPVPGRTNVRIASRLRYFERFTARSHFCNRERSHSLSRHTIACLALLIFAAGLPAAEYPPVSQSDYIIKDFHFNSGETLPELKMHYRFFGTPQRNEKGVVTNAVLILHGTTGSGANFTVPGFAGELFGAGQLLDATKYYLVLPDNVGHGQSSKPSDGMHAKFPKYGYRDMIEAQYQLLTEGLKVNHLRLVMGTSMGGMHTWLWGEMHPDYMDALMPLASVPGPMSGRNRMWRRIIIDAITKDPSWMDGDYTTQPNGLRTVSGMMFLMADNPVQRQKQAPSLKDADRVFDAGVAGYMRTLDANNALYAFEGSRDYDPAPDLEKITAPLLAINSADDLINPPELGILERQIKRVKNGEAIMIPLSDETRGHGTHTMARLWKNHLAGLLKRSEHH